MQNYFFHNHPASQTPPSLSWLYVVACFWQEGFCQLRPCSVRTAGLASHPSVLFAGRNWEGKQRSLNLLIFPYGEPGVLTKRTRRPIQHISISFALLAYKDSWAAARQKRTWRASISIKRTNNLQNTNTAFQTPCTRSEGECKAQ